MMLANRASSNVLDGRLQDPLREVICANITTYSNSISAVRLDFFDNLLSLGLI